jgi:hypothetical protein
LLIIKRKVALLYKTVRYSTFIPLYIVVAPRAWPVFPPSQSSREIISRSRIRIPEPVLKFLSAYPPRSLPVIVIAFHPLTIQAVVHRLLSEMLELDRHPWIWLYCVVTFVLTVTIQALWFLNSRQKAMEISKAIERGPMSGDVGLISPKKKNTK